MEVAYKPRADVNGDAIIQYEWGLCLLRWLIKKFKIFNKNDLWIRLVAILATTDENALGVVNPKTSKNCNNVL